MTEQAGMEHTAEVLIVGDEVLAGEIADANGPLLLAALARAGARTLGVHIVPDARDVISGSIRGACERADSVLVTGGIGPTHDDCTRPALADALDLPLELHREARDRLRGIFGDRATPDEEAMASLPRGATLFTAPGTGSFGFRVGNVTVFPGVPHLLRRLLEANPHLLSGRPRKRRERITRVREGVLAGALRDLARRWPEVSWGSYPELTGGAWRVRLVLRAVDEAALEEAVDALEAILTGLEARPPGP